MPWDQGPGLRCPGALVPGIPSKGTPFPHSTKSLYTRTVVRKVVYYESLNRELKTKPLYEFRCDERLKTKVEESTRLAYPVRLFMKLNFKNPQTVSISRNHVSRRRRGRRWRRRRRRRKRTSRLDDPLVFLDGIPGTRAPGHRSPGPWSQGIFLF